MGFHKHDIVAVTNPSRWQTLRRKINQADRERWRASDYSKGMTSGGDTKLQHPTTGRQALAGETFKVVRGRARFSDGWGNPTSGWTLVVDSHGQEYFAPTSSLTAQES
jgi:hypothetical protein